MLLYILFVKSNIRNGDVRWIPWVRFELECSGPVSARQASGAAVFLFSSAGKLSNFIPNLNNLSLSSLRDFKDDNGDAMCWKGVTHVVAYRIFVIAYVICIGPFVFFNAQKTTLLQIISSALRHTC